MDARTQARIKALSKEPITLVPYDESWAERYVELEKEVKRIVPRQHIQRIAHIGSTAIPGISAKPIIDIQVEVGDVERVREEVAPLMQEAGFEFVWRPSMGDDAPYYAWFILRDADGKRVAHVHMVGSGKASMERIVFRDYLRTFPEEAARYEALKQELARRFPKDREAYTTHKAAYVNDVLAKAHRGKWR